MMHVFSCRVCLLDSLRSVFVLLTDADIAGDYLLAEAKFPLSKVLPQLQRKFQIALEKPDLRVSYSIMLEGDFKADGFF